MRIRTWQRNPPGMPERFWSAGPLETFPAQTKLQELDEWLRADGHRRNPGTTADLVAASLFAAFREGVLRPCVARP